MPLHGEGYTPVDEATHGSLVEKCQENEWVMCGGNAWRDDPYLEEYPYDFVEAHDMAHLHDFFEHGNWSIRQGIVYDDLAFVQQVDGGDEWWTLKRDGGSWVDFESANYGRMIAEDPDRFPRIIASMQAASPEDCKDLNYDFPESAADRLADLSEEYMHYEIADEFDDPESFRAYVIRSIMEGPEKIADFLDELAEETDDRAASALADEIRDHIDEIEPTALADKAQAAQRASDAMGRERRAIAALAREI